MDNFFGACKFPTLTILIDDNFEFLDLFARHLMQQNVLTEFFQSDSPLTKGNSYKTIDHFKELKTNLIEESFLETNLSNLHNIVYSRDRFSLLSTIVVDYDMPVKTGLEICKECKIPYVQKCILSNIMCEDDVIEAFNKKEINSFIRKNDRNFFLTGDSVIKKVQNGFFNKITERISESVPILKNAEFKKFVTDAIKEANAVEMYLLDKNGSFLFLDADGKASGIISYNQLNSEFIKEKAKLLGIKLAENEFFAYVNLDNSKVVCNNADFYVSSIAFFRQIQTDDGLYNCTFSKNSDLFINLYTDKIVPFNQYKKELASKIFRQIF